MIAVIPAYNEVESLPTTLSELARVRPDIDIVVVDDGSTDRTSEIAKQAGIHVVTLPVNLGVGGAVQTGLRLAYKLGYDIAFQYDADGQHRADMIEDLTAPIFVGEADFVMGSRFQEKRGYKVDPLKRAMMWLLRTVTSRAMRHRMTDTTSGFRAYNRDAIKFMIDNCSVDHPEFESIIWMSRSGYRFKEIPCSMRERAAGQSMFMRPGHALYYMVRCLMGVIVSVLLPPKVRITKPADHGGES